MPERSLSFKSVKGRLKLLGFGYMPYATGGGFFVGNDRKLGEFPWATGPICTVGPKHKDDDIIPEKAMLNWFLRLGLTPKELEQFWAVEDHSEQPSQETSL